MTRITRDCGSLAFDDRLAALAGAVAYFLEAMSRDSEQAAIAHKERMADEELERFVANALGHPSEGPRQWASGVMRGEPGFSGPELLVCPVATPYTISSSSLNAQPTRYSGTGIVESSPWVIYRMYVRDTYRCYLDVYRWH